MGNRCRDNPGCGGCWDPALQQGGGYQRSLRSGGNRREWRRTMSTGANECRASGECQRSRRDDDSRRGTARVECGSVRVCRRWRIAGGLHAEQWPHSAPGQLSRNGWWWGVVRERGHAGELHRRRLRGRVRWWSVCRHSAVLYDCGERGNIGRRGLRRVQ